MTTSSQTTEQQNDTFLHYEMYVGWWLLTEDANGNRFVPWTKSYLFTDRDAQQARARGVPIR